jgi:hypothetical protein
MVKSRGPVADVKVFSGSGSNGNGGGGSGGHGADTIGMAVADEAEASPDRNLVGRDQKREHMKHRFTQKRRLRERLSADERAILELRMNPPAELVVMARNLNGDDFTKRGAVANEITADDIAQFTGTPRAEVRRLIRTARVKCTDLRRAAL